jgi:hypothetical protein
MNAVLKSKTLCCSEFFEGFLKLADTSAFASLKKSVEKTKRPEFMIETYSTEGVQLCDADNDFEYIRNLNEYVCNTEILRSRLRAQATQLSQTLEGVASCLAGMTETFKHLAQLQQSFVDNKLALNLYSNLSTTFANWGRFEHLMAAHVDESMVSHLTYQSSELFPLKDLIREREAHYAAYLKTDAKVKSRKEKLWSEGNTSKWELSAADAKLASTLAGNKELAFSKMLANETLYSETLKDRFGYFNVQVKEQSARVLKDGIESDLNFFNEYSKIEAELCTSHHMTWTQLRAKLTDERLESIAVSSS